MLPFIVSFVVTCILHADMCLDIVSDFIWFIKRKKESVHFWIWQKTHKDEVNERLKSWAMAIEDIGETYREGIESWAEAIAHKKCRDEIDKVFKTMPTKFRGKELSEYFIDEYRGKV